jgi:hypothetical protein
MYIVICDVQERCQAALLSVLSSKASVLLSTGQKVIVMRSLVDFDASIVNVLLYKGNMGHLCINNVRSRRKIRLPKKEMRNVVI